MHCKANDFCCHLKRIISAIILSVLSFSGFASEQTATYKKGYQSFDLTPVVGEEALLATLNKNFEEVSDYQPNTQITARSSNSTITPVAPSSVKEMARALKYDLDLIREYVYLHVDTYPVWGIQKGALGALIESKGTPADLAMLTKALLDESDIEAYYTIGFVKLSGDFLARWFGLDANSACGITQVLVNSQIPYKDAVFEEEVDCNGQANLTKLTSIAVGHVWIEAIVDGRLIALDTSLKDNAYSYGLNKNNIYQIVGYSRNDLMSTAVEGATFTSTSVTNLNRDGVRQKMDEYTTKLIEHFRKEYPTGSLTDVIGGYERRGLFPFNYNAYERQLNLNQLPNSLRVLLTIQYEGIDFSLYSDEMAGKRITITYSEDHRPILNIDGVEQARGNILPSGHRSEILLKVEHRAYSIDSVNLTTRHAATEGGIYLVAANFGNVGHTIIDHQQAKSSLAQLSGVDPDSEETKGNNLGLLAANWFVQLQRSSDIESSLLDTKMLYHHLVGIAGYNGSPYIDVAAATSSVHAVDDVAQKKRFIMGHAGHGSILESTSVEQNSGAPAASAASVLDFNAKNGGTFYQMTAANFDQVYPNLINCSAYRNTLQGFVNEGSVIQIPKNCAIQINEWSGVGYYTINNTDSSLAVGALVHAGQSNFDGGYSTLYTRPITWYTRSYSMASSQRLRQNTRRFFGDPIDMTKGNYIFEKSDISTGFGEFPNKLTYTRQYSSGLNTTDSTMGYGWKNNLTYSVRKASNGLQAFGLDSALDATAVIVEHAITQDLLFPDNPNLPASMTAAILNGWLSEQLMDNTVIVEKGLNGDTFVELADGTYNSPPASAALLSKSDNDLYSYTAQNNEKLEFSEDGKLDRLIRPDGFQVKFSYLDGLISEIKNSVGRQLSFQYNAEGKLSKVTAGTRSVNYTYDTDGNLSTSTNARGDVTRYTYDDAHRMYQYFMPSKPNVAVVTNQYDTEGRIRTQNNQHGQQFEYFFSGTRSEEVGPYGKSKISYVNYWGKTLKEISAEGYVKTKEYDNLNRKVKEVFPEGNYVKYSYDDASCINQKRCNHKVSLETHFPKPESGNGRLRYKRITYHPVFNEVTTITDFRGNRTYNYYNEKGQLTATLKYIDQEEVNTKYEYSDFSTEFGPISLVTEKTEDVNLFSQRKTTYTYNVAGHLEPYEEIVDSRSGGLNLTTTRGYNSSGDLISLDGPRTDVNDVVIYSYDVDRNKVSTLHPDGAISKSAYDGDNNLIRSANKLGNKWMVTCVTYTDSQKEAMKVGPYLTSSEATCPSMTSVHSPVTVKNYDALDRVSDSTELLLDADGGSRKTAYTYYLDDKKKTISQAVGSDSQRTYLSLTYTPNGKLQTETDAGGAVTKYDYDGFDRMVKKTFPDKNIAGQLSNFSEEFEHDKNGNVTAEKRRSGAWVYKFYDEVNKLRRIDYPGTNDDIYFGYDYVGNKTVSRYINNRNVIIYEYDIAGRLVAKTSDNKTINYQYDNAGNRIRMEWPEFENDEFFISMEYDSRNRMERVLEKDSFVLASYTYDDLSRRISVMNGNNTSVNYTFNDAGRILRLSNDLVGNEQDIEWNYQTNRVGEITKVDFDNERFIWRSAESNDLSFTANLLNQYTNINGSSIVFDARGNLISDKDGTRYRYDLDNKLTSVIKNGRLTSLYYDAEGDLSYVVSPGSKTRLYYSGKNLIGEYEPNRKLRKRYVFGPDVDEPLVSYTGDGFSDAEWLYKDHLGSIVGKAGLSGAMSDIYAYGLFGEQSIYPNSRDERFGFTGQQHFDDLGLVYFKARFYSPSIGRFMQVDPIGYKDNRNLYLYAKNNPMINKDPTGKFYVQAIGAGVSFAANFLYQTQTRGFGNYDYVQLGTSAAIGAVNAHLGVRYGIGSTVAGTFAVGAGSNVAQMGISDYRRGRLSPTTNYIYSGFSGGLSNLIGGRVSSFSYRPSSYFSRSSIGRSAISSYVGNAK
ncbi:DUF6531 domain-containing protein [Enterovibrio makurazakiensis]|uniref:RHS repeat-associated core domain-containing protein n=1 Tax=Enterovibrio makurazakiensis TaxID=2910232 RepID=UPI003D22D7E7